MESCCSYAYECLNILRWLTGRVHYSSDECWFVHSISSRLPFSFFFRQIMTENFIVNNYHKYGSQDWSILLFSSCVLSSLWQYENTRKEKKETTSNKKKMDGWHISREIYLLTGEHLSHRRKYICQDEESSVPSPYSLPGQCDDRSCCTKKHILQSDSSFRKPEISSRREKRNEKGK